MASDLPWVPSWGDDLLIIKHGHHEIISADNSMPWVSLSPTWSETPIASIYFWCLCDVYLDICILSYKYMYTVIYDAYRWFWRRVDTSMCEQIVCNRQFLRESVSKVRKLPVSVGLVDPEAKSLVRMLWPHHFFSCTSWSCEASESGTHLPLCWPCGNLCFVSFALTYVKLLGLATRTSPLCWMIFGCPCYGCMAQWTCRWFSGSL